MERCLVSGSCWGGGWEEGHVSGRARYNLPVLFLAGPWNGYLVEARRWTGLCVCRLNLSCVVLGRSTSELP